jgi:hypothetical protein
MNVLAQGTTPRGARLLVAHLESLDLHTVQARERLEVELGDELARKLVFALAARRPVRREEQASAA